MHTQKYNYDVDEIVKVVDGDTFRFRLDLGFGVFKQTTVRLLGVDTAEIYGVKKESDEYKRGMEQKRFVNGWIKEQNALMVSTKKDETGKYGRYLAYVKGDDGYLTDALLNEFPELGVREETPQNLLEVFENTEPSS